MKPYTISTRWARILDCVYVATCNTALDATAVPRTCSNAVAIGLQDVIWLSRRQQRQPTSFSYKSHQSDRPEVALHRVKPTSRPAYATVPLTCLTRLSLMSRQNHVQTHAHARRETLVMSIYRCETEYARAMPLRMTDPTGYDSCLSRSP